MAHLSLPKKPVLFLFSIFTACILHAQDVPTSAPAVKSFALGENLTGLASNSVNLHTGDVALPLTLVTLSGHNGLDVAVSMGYSSNVRNSINTWNLESPAGILGLGWNLDLPKIAVDNKQTGTREDDEYFLIEGGVSHAMVRTTSGSDADGGFYVYEMKNYQFWKIRYYYDPQERDNNPGATSGSNKWVIIKEDGTTYVYGDKNSTRNTLQYVVRWGNWIGNSSQLIGQGRLVSMWNLGEIKNVWNEKILFEYENVEQFVGTASGLKHTEASYLKKITDVWGRKVVFFYNDRNAEFFAEPHTEQAEPDAYQESYEKKYLDHIDVLNETDVKFMSVHFTYSSVNSGTSTAKMLLTSIVQKNGTGQALPGVQFEYYASGDSKGLLKTVTSPTGGTVTYTYTANVIGHSNRELTINAPAGYAEGRTWIADDYVVVTWRQLGGGGSHYEGPATVKLYVYQWVGEWKEQFLQTIGSVSLTEGDYSFKEYKDFSVTLQSNFFAVYSNGTVFIRWKDPQNRGNWLAYSSTHGYGDDMPTLMSGTNFVALGSDEEDVGAPSHFYTFQGDTWQDYTYDQAKGDLHYTGTNNFLISHNRGSIFSFPPVEPEINFYFLTEDKKWVSRLWANSLEFSANDPCYWYSSPGMAIAMADNNPEFAYRWDVGYNTFWKDETERFGGQLFGQLPDQAAVFMMNNGLVGINGRLARYDGKDWTVTDITSTHTSPSGLYFSYGEDFVVRPTEYVGATFNYKGGLKQYNPNTRTWLADVIMDGADRGNDYANAGQDYYYFGNGFYYRQHNGAWIKKHTYGSYNGMWSKSGHSRMEVMHGSYPAPVSEVRYFKNGEISGPHTAIWNRNLLYVPYRFKSIGVGTETVITYPATFSAPENATTFQLNRLVNEAIWGTQTDYVVSLVAVNDGTTTNYISFEYNTTTAAIDPTGNTAQYNEVTEIPGSNTPSNRPFGYTKTFFHNGLTFAELGVPYFPSELLWNGMPYKKEVYNKDNALLSSSKSTFQTFSRSIYNDLSVKVNAGNYVRLYEERSIIDNIESYTTHSYDGNTGLVSISMNNNVDSKNTSTMTTYKYFWEQYDVLRDKNILSPVIQTKTSLWNPSVGETVIDVTAITWKLWNNVFAPHKTYNWRKSGNSVFDFSLWSGAGEPAAANWLKVSEINTIDVTGNVLQITYK